MELGVQAQAQVVIVEFIDFSERAPFSLLGIFMMVELAAVIFGITTALQRELSRDRGLFGDRNAPREDWRADADRILAATQP